MPCSRELDQLIRTHRTNLWWYLRGLGCEREAAEDLAQETFVALMTSGFQVRSHAATFRWLKTTARNKYVSALRREKRETPVDGDTIDALWARFSPDERMDEIRVVLRDCMQALTERAQQTVRLRFESGHKTNEIATALEIKPAAVTKLLQRAKRSLRHCLERNLPSEEESR